MAERAVKSGKVRIRPKNFEKTYLSWTENVRDWSVSRQIWWGHQLPVYFCENDGEKFTVSAEKPKKCPFCNDCAMKRSEDVLDTWFSSALWPFAGMSEKDISNYYPGNALIRPRYSESLGRPDDILLPGVPRSGSVHRCLHKRNNPLERRPENVQKFGYRH